MPKKLLATTISAILIVLFMVTFFPSMTVDSEPPLAQWSKTFTNSYGKGNSIIATSDGGYAIAGVSNQHFLLAKIDSSGEVIWWKTYQTGEATCVIQTSEGGFALAGSGGVNFIKTDSSGNILWSKTFTNGGITFKINSIIQTSVGEFVLAGYTPAGNSPSWDWTVKIDSQGTIIWSKTYGTRPGQSFATNIMQVSDGYVLAANLNLYKLNDNGDVQWNQSTIVGSSLVKTTDGGYLLASGSGSTLVKFDSDGNVEWSKAYSHSSSFFHSAIETQDGGFVAAGITFPLYQGLAWIVKTDSNGTQEWSITSEPFTGHNNLVNSIIEVNSSVFVLAGAIQSISNGSYNEVWLAQVSNSILPASTVLNPEEATNSPSPTPLQMPTQTPTPTRTPIPTPSVPEYSWLAILPLLATLYLVAEAIKRYKHLPTQ